MPPPRETMRVYYAENLPEAMKTEVRLFFRHLLRENGSVQQFLEALKVGELARRTRPA